METQNHHRHTLSHPKHSHSFTSTTRCTDLVTHAHTHIARGVPILPQRLLHRLSWEKETHKRTEKVKDEQRGGGGKKKRSAERREVQAHYQTQKHFKCWRTSLRMPRSSSVGQERILAFNWDKLPRRIFRYEESSGFACFQIYLIADILLWSGFFFRLKFTGTQRL